MKSDWSVSQLGDLVSFKSGGTPSKKNKSYWTGSIPWVSAKAMKSEHIQTSDLFISQEGLMSGSKLAPAGSLLLLTRGSGLFNGIPLCYVDLPVAFNQDVKCIESRSEVSNKYIFYWLLSQNKYLMAKVGVTGIGAGKFDTDFLSQLEVYYPGYEDREKIVAIADIISEQILTNQSINDNLQQVAFTSFDQLCNGAQSFCALSDFAEINPKRNITKNMVARCIDMSQLSTSGAFPAGWITKPYTGGMKFVNGDTLLARITPCLENGKTAYIDFLNEDETAFGSTEYIVLSAKEDTPPELLYCLARYPSFVDYAVKNMNGSSGRQRVSADTIAQFQIPQFNADELAAFGATASKLFQLMKANSLENMKLAALRDILLPKLMSGEIDVSDVQL